MDDLVFRARLNELVREATQAQEAFDLWDEGMTFYPGSMKSRPVTLDVVVAEWNAANAALVRFVLDNAAALEEKA